MSDATTQAATDSRGMDYLRSLPRRWVVVYIPLIIFVIVLIFPFYWMVVTTFKPASEMFSQREFSPFWMTSVTFENVRKLLFDTEFPSWFMNTMIISVSSTFLSIVASVLAAYAIARIRFKGADTAGFAIFLAYLVPPSILFIPLSTIVMELDLFDTPWALILTYPTFLIPFCTWLLIGYFKAIPYELEECAVIDGASRLQILTRIVLPLAVPGLISVIRTP